MEKIFRTHNCGELRKENIGEQVILSGWVDARRDHGGVIFIDLRDFYGKTQVAFDPTRNKKAWEIADSIRSEYVILVKGKVSPRPKDMVNTKIKTGEIEIDGFEIEILSKAKTLPFEVNEVSKANEDLRLKYRYLDLRSQKMKENIVFRSKFIKYIRDWMYKNDFIEIETPILTSSTPEGARDFLVPSRLHKGKFYALPQAPQQYKQLLMVSGFDRYFQIAPCMRDEDARADRVLGEFYQIDIETSFMNQEQFLNLMEEFFIDVCQNLSKKKLLFDKFPRLTYKETMEKYGTDKPDLRFGLEFHDITEVVKNCEFKVFSNAELVKGICVENASERIGRNEIDRIMIPLAQENGAGGMAWMRMTEKGLESSIVKFFKEQELENIKQIFNPKPGDILFFIADKREIVLKTLGVIRNYCAQRMDLIDEDVLAFVWITDFPMFEYNEDLGKWDFAHNPFSLPQGDLSEILEKRPDQILAYQYDIVCNGYELGSGAVRNYNSEMLLKLFEIVGYSRDFVYEKFGHMIDAFNYGAPPHCGIAPGLERFLMILLGEPSVKNVIAFPKTNKGQDLVVGAPSEVDPQQLKELGIKIEE